jgi:glycosyltransferase involved in cell wall biosynthesis
MHTIDVIIPLFNDKKYIFTAVNSALNQSYPVNKIYVIDDGSTDNALDELKEVFRDEPRVIPIKRLHQGRSSARNYGISLSKADFIAFLDSDDLWHPDKIFKQIEVYERNSNYGCIYCAYDVIDAKGILIKGASSIEPSLKDNIFLYLLEANIISGSASAILIKRSLLDEVGGFNEDLSFGEDWELWLRLSQVAKFSYSTDALASIRTSNKPPRNRYFDRKNQDYHHFKIWAKWPKESSNHPEVRKHLREIFLNRSVRSNLSLKRRLLTAFSVLKWTQANQSSELYALLFPNRLYLFLIIIREHYYQAYIRYRSNSKILYHKSRHYFFLLLKIGNKKYHLIRHQINLTARSIKAFFK